MAEYKLIDQEHEIRRAVKELREHNMPGASSSPGLLAVDCEGDNLGRRDGTLSIVSVAVENVTYLFDVKKLGAAVFDRGLRDLLQDSERQKLMFDCRCDSDCLWHQYKVKLTNVLDLQIMQIIYRETHPEPPKAKDTKEAAGRGAQTNRQGKPARPTAREPPRPPVLKLRGFVTCLDFYVNNEELNRAKVEGMERMKREGCVVWLERPLDKTLLDYASADVQGFFLLYSALKPGVSTRNDLSRLQEASEKYLNYLRSHEVRTYGIYEKNAFLPWRLLPERGEPFSYRKDVICNGCKGRFPRGDFIPAQMRSRNQNCPVCRKVYFFNSQHTS